MIEVILYFGILIFKIVLIITSQYQDYITQTKERFKIIDFLKTLNDVKDNA